MAGITLLVERVMSRDEIVIRHPNTREVVARWVRKRDGHKWIGQDEDIQAICDEWGAWSTAGGLATVIAASLTIGPTPEGNFPIKEGVSRGAE